MMAKKPPASSEPPDDDEAEVLNTADVARIMRCGRRKIQLLAKTRQLPMKLFGGEWIITRKRLKEFLEAS